MAENSGSKHASKACKTRMAKNGAELKPYVTVNIHPTMSNTLYSTDSVLKFQRLSKFDRIVFVVVTSINTIDE